MKVYTDRDYISPKREIHSGWKDPQYTTSALEGGRKVPSGMTAELVDAGSPARPACWELTPSKPGVPERHE